MAGLRDNEESREPLIPIHNGGVSGKNAASSTATGSSLWFKAYVIVTMTFLWTGYTLTVRYTRSTVPKKDLYSATTVVLSAEVVKLLITVVMLFRDNNYSIREFHKCLNTYFFGAPREILKMSIPSLAYALQNNLDFIGLSNLDAGLYQVTTQLKVVTTALFMMIFLGRKFSGTRWAAILMLFVGVAAVQLNNVSGGLGSHRGENYFVGISAVLATCVTAGFAGVYFEMMLKDGGSTPFWMRNMQMYSCGVVSAMLACMLTESEAIGYKGFFFGYDYKVFCIVGFLSVGGVYISLVMKHLDNLHKSFASAVSIILVVVLSFFVFDGVFIGLYFMLGTCIVVTAVLLYNSVSE